MAIVNRGFRGRPRQPGAGLIPPGQYVVEDFPVLTAGPTPEVSLAHWDFTIVDEAGAQAARWTWPELQALPAEDFTVDIHCVTKWSKLATTWTGVSLDTLLEGVETEAEYALAFSDGDYTTNLPLADLRDGQAWVAFAYDGEPLEPEHGGPARLLVPHLYLWKSAKWVRGIRLLDQDEPGLLGERRLPQLRRSVARAAVLGRLSVHWLVASVIETIPETTDATTLRLDVPDWSGHRAGQHVDLRLTAEDGYSAQRSYSIASAPDADRVELTVVRIDEGEVSPYLTTVVDAGDQLELRGPIGGYFVWEPGDGRPTLLVGGGSGVVPLVAMLRQHAALGDASPMCLLYSARTQHDLLFRDELERLAEGPRTVTTTLTREPAGAWHGRRGRIDRALLARLGWPPEAMPRCFVCGPTPFVEATASSLVELGHAPTDVRTERFGPTGD